MYVRELSRFFAYGKMRRIDSRVRRRPLRPIKWQVIFNHAAKKHGKSLSGGIKNQSLHRVVSEAFHT